MRLFSQYVSRKTAFLAVIDTLLIGCALAAGAALLNYDEPFVWRSDLDPSQLAYRSAIVAACLLTCGYYTARYALPATVTAPSALLGTARSVGAGCALLATVLWLFPVLMLGRSPLAAGLALSLALLTFSKIFVDFAWSAAGARTNVLLLGAGRLASEVAGEIEARPELMMRVVGFVRPSAGEAPLGVAASRLLGSCDELASIAAGYRARKIIVALEERRGATPALQLLRLRVGGIEIEDAHAALAALTGRIRLESVGSSWMIFSDGFHRSRGTLALKRLIDVAGALAALVLLAPLGLAVAAAVKLDSDGGVFYRQLRVGRGGTLFRLLKFRTMRQDAEADGVARWAAENDSRVTRCGAFLRKYRLDELPQILSVLRGEMSFVGPRPERPELVAMLRDRTPFYDERHTLRPGLSGWAQVRYPYCTSVSDARRKLEFDLFYLKNVSIAFDLAILLQTVRIVLLGHGR